MKIGIVSSPQNLVDCSKPWGPNGCHGGLMHNAYKYIRDQGMVLESDYPYTAAEGTCKFNFAKSIGKVRGGTIVIGEDALQDTIAAAGPVGVRVDTKEWKLYHGGIFAPKQAFKTLIHGVVDVACGTEGGLDYYNLRNSYGPNWGLKGFIRIVRNQNNAFGVANAGVLPTL